MAAPQAELAAGRCAPAEGSSAWPALRRSGFSLLELVVTVAVIVAIAAIAIPAYRGYVATARDGALLNRMASMAVFQEETRLRTGAYGAGVHDPASGLDTLSRATGWQPGEDAATYRVVADGGRSWTVTATDANGRSLCRVFPAGDECPAP